LTAAIILIARVKFLFLYLARARRPWLRTWAALLR